MAEPSDRTGYDNFRENAEALLVAVILAIIIRHFAVEAFEIPTGSMANTLYGLHAWLKCPNCSTDFNVALQSDSSTGEVSVRYEDLWVYDGRCTNPNCTLSLHSRRGPGEKEHLNEPGSQIFCTSCKAAFQGTIQGYRRTQAIDPAARCPICQHVYIGVIEKSNAYLGLFEKGNKTGGHKILVTKFAYALGKPQRWDVIVFGFDEWKNYIKRLVGLPGERINIWDGDLYVNGKIERKSKRPNVEDVLWTKLADSDVSERGLNPVPAWGEIQPDGAGRNMVPSKNAQWNPVALRWSLNAPGDLALLEYRRGFENYYNYNLITHGTHGYPPISGTDGSRHPAEVGDKKVAFTVKVAAVKPKHSGEATGQGNGSWVGAQIRDGDFTFQLRIPVGAASDANPAVIERVPPMPGGIPPLHVAAAAAIPVGTEARVEFENADDRIAARLNGKEILSLEYSSLPEGASFDAPPPAPSQEEGAQHLRLVVCGAQAEVSSIQVFRDMYYIAQNNRGLWHGIQLGPGEYFAMGDNAPSSSDGRYWGSIPEKNLMGQALLIFWPAWPTNFQWRFIR